jgi:CheY-like chemotaxis protein
MMKKKILIIDDDYDILEPLSLILKNEGYIVETITKGQQTYTKVTEFKPDLILLDILMSGSDGRTICKKLKQTNATKHIPIILMSAHPGAENDAKVCGADDMIPKPFETEDLIKIVAKNCK